MKLTDKCKQDFEKWLLNKKYSITDDVGERQPNIVNLANHIYHLPQEMQYGVLVDFFDENEIDINIAKHIDMCVIQIFKSNTSELLTDINCKTRQDAREQSIVYANEIYNKL